MSSAEIYASYTSALGAKDYRKAKSLLPQVQHRLMIFADIDDLRPFLTNPNPALIPSLLLSSRTATGATILLPDSSTNEIVEMLVNPEDVSRVVTTILFRTGTSLLGLEGMCDDLRRSTRRVGSGRKLLFHDGIIIHPTEWGDFAPTFQETAEGKVSVDDVITTIRQLHQEEYPLRVSRQRFVKVPLEAENLAEVFAACLLAKYTRFDVLKEEVVTQRGIVELFYPSTEEESLIVEQMTADDYRQLMTKIWPLLDSFQIQLLNDTIRQVRTLHADYPAISLMDVDRKTEEEVEQETFAAIEQTFTFRRTKQPAQAALTLHNNQSAQERVFSFDDLFRYASFKTGKAIKKITFDATKKEPVEQWHQLLRRRREKRSEITIARDISGYYLGNPLTMTISDHESYTIGPMVTADGYEVPLASLGIRVSNNPNMGGIIGTIGYYDGNEFSPRINTVMVRTKRSREDVVQRLQSSYKQSRGIVGGLDYETNKRIRDSVKELSEEFDTKIFFITL